MGRPVSLEKLKKLRAKLKKDFDREYGKACLVGCGIVPTDLLTSTGGSTQVFDMSGGVPRLRTDHPLVGRVFFIEGNTSLGLITLGRDSDSDVTIPDYPISKNHCTFQYTTEGHVITDVGSTNGTYVEFDRLPSGTPKPLDDRTRLVLGRFGFRFYKSAVTLLADENPLGDFTPFG